MLNIISPGYKKILELFYEERKPYHLRMIAKKTGLNENSVYRFLSTLERKNILQSTKEGNLKLFRLKNNLQSYTILTAFDIERYGKLKKIRRQAIETYIKSLKEIPVFIVLFGSTAKGTFREDSDIDLLLVTNRRIKSEKAEYEVDAQTGLKVSTFQILYQSFLEELKLRKDQVIQSAIKTGYPLINHILYYEVINNENL